MTVSVQETIFPYTANGVTTSFPFSCMVLQASDLYIAVDGVEVTTGFTVSGIGNETGGSIEFAVAPANLASIVVQRLLALERLTDYQQHGDWLALVVNADVDRTWMALQQQQAQIDLSFKLPISTTGVSTELPVPVAGRGLKWAPDGLSLILTSSDPDSFAINAAASAATATAAAATATASKDTAVAAAVAAAVEADAAAASAASVDPANLVHKTGAETIAGIKTFTNDVAIGAGAKIVMEGTTDDAFEVTIDPGNPTADRALALPNKSGTVATTSDIVSEPYIYIRDEKPSATDGGDFTSGAWRTRVLNTEVNDAIGLATLATNQITLAAGTYRFKARAPGYNVGAHQVRLQNITDTISYYGSTEFLGTVVAQSDSFVSGKFTIAAAKVFELQHQCSLTKTGNGFGTSAGFGNVNVNAEIEFWKEF